MTSHHPVATVPIQALAEGMTSLLRLSRSLVLSGSAIDLAGLDERIGVLCAQALDQSDGPGLAQYLAEIVIALDALAAALGEDQADQPPATS